MASKDKETPTVAPEADPAAFQRWVTKGRRLAKKATGTQWEVGDWWAEGDHSYGDRARTAVEVFHGEYAFGTLMNMGRVAKAFETSRRREVLSFGHHAAVAALEQPEQDKLLDEAESEGLSVRKLMKLSAALAPGAQEEDPEPADEEITPDNVTVKAESYLATVDGILDRDIMAQLEPGPLDLLADRLAQAQEDITKIRKER